MLTINNLSRSKFAILGTILAGLYKDIPRHIKQPKNNYFEWLTVIKYKTMLPIKVTWNM